eukprot:6206048-Pleurochrysis_carterae.AAC.3
MLWRVKSFHASLLFHALRRQGQHTLLSRMQDTMLCVGAWRLAACESECLPRQACETSCFQPPVRSTNTVEVCGAVLVVVCTVCLENVLRVLTPARQSLLCYAPLRVRHMKLFSSALHML